MAKKYIAPAMKVINVDNDIITDSLGWSGNAKNASEALKGGMMDFDFEDEEF